MVIAKLGRSDEDRLGEIGPRRLARAGHVENAAQHGRRALAHIAAVELQLK
jgi:hypothetical protein